MAEGITPSNNTIVNRCHVLVEREMVTSKFSILPNSKPTILPTQSPTYVFQNIVPRQSSSHRNISGANHARGMPCMTEYCSPLERARHARWESKESERHARDVKAGKDTSSLRQAFVSLSRLRVRGVALEAYVVRNILAKTRQTQRRVRAFATITKSS